MAIDLGMDLELVLNLLMDLRDKLLLVPVNLDKLLRRCRGTGSSTATKASGASDYRSGTPGPLFL